MISRLVRSTASTRLLARLLNAPDLVREVQELAPRSFATLVRQVGIEDAGELVALASTPQLVAAFDEDLFVNTRPGQHERFDGRRFAVWLEVLLEAGDEVVARRVAELSEDFMSLALSSLMVVLDQEALLIRLEERDADAVAADKVIEGGLSEEIDGYLLIARDPEGWDAVLSLVLALDREDRTLLERLLDRCARAASEYIDDLAALTGLLTDAESLADDVEGEREERRAKQGYVEPRAAQNFLELARRPMSQEAAAIGRDPVSQAYFRELDRGAPAQPPGRSVVDEVDELAGLLAASSDDGASPVAGLPAPSGGTARLAEHAPGGGGLAEAMRLLGEDDADALDARMEELAFLANVLLSGAEKDAKRLEPAQAAQAALATVTLGAELEAAQRAGSGAREQASPRELCQVLAACTADALFRKASSALAASPTSARAEAVVYDPEEVPELLARLRRA